jgi:hypothetical protein
MLTWGLCHVDTVAEKAHDGGMNTTEQETRIKS